MSKILIDTNILVYGIDEDPAWLLRINLLFLSSPIPAHFWRSG
jgi:hypothetical protein